MKPGIQCRFHGRVILRALQRLDEFTQGTAGDHSHPNESITVPNMGTSKKTIVDDSVSVEASRSHNVHQCSTSDLQRIQNKSLGFDELQQISIKVEIRFGTRFPTLNSPLRISGLQRQVCGIWGSVGISEVQFRLQLAISSISSRTEVPQFLPFSNSGWVVDPLGLHQGCGITKRSGERRGGRIPTVFDYGRSLHRGVTWLTAHLGYNRSCGFDLLQRSDDLRPRMLASAHPSFPFLRPNRIPKWTDLGGQVKITVRRMGQVSANVIADCLYPIRTRIQLCANLWEADQFHPRSPKARDRGHPHPSLKRPPEPGPPANSSTFAIKLSDCPHLVYIIEADVKEDEHPKESEGKKPVLQAGKSNRRQSGNHDRISSDGG